MTAYPTSSAPTIDGQMGSGEWDDADSFDGTDLDIYTMQDGTYRFLDLAPGSYRVLITAKGCRPHGPRTVRIKPNEAFPIGVTLQKRASQ